MRLTERDVMRVRLVGLTVMPALAGLLLGFAERSVVGGRVDDRGGAAAFIVTAVRVVLERRPSIMLPRASECEYLSSVAKAVTSQYSQLCPGTGEVELRLQRLSGSMHSHHEASDAYRVDGRQGEPNDWRAYVDFQRFGAGSENFSWFKVLLGWSDIEALIQTFSAMDHPEAARLLRARKLAAAFDEFSKVSPGQATS